MENKLDMDIINNTLEVLDKIIMTIRFGRYTGIHRSKSIEISDNLTIISVMVKDLFPEHSDRIAKLKKNLFMDNGAINTHSLCQLHECVYLLKVSIERDRNNKWMHIHEKFNYTVREKFLHGFYSDSIFTATNILMQRLKKINHHIDPQSPDIDGADLIGKLFSKNSTHIILCNQNTKTGENIQKGYVDFFNGWISAIRNKNAHSPNEEMDESEAYQQLSLISMLMAALDNRLTPPIFEDE